VAKAKTQMETASRTVMKTLSLAFSTLVATVFLGQTAVAFPTLSNGSLTGLIANGGVPAGWTVIAGSPDTMDQTHNVGTTGVPFFVAPSGPSPDGGTWVGYGRDINSGGFTEIFGQSVSGFQIGSSYLLSWYEGNFGAQTGPGYGQPNRIGVSLNGNFAGSGALIAPSSAWTSDGISFTAMSTTIQINFGLTESGPSYLSIDGISLTQVPEPSSLALLGMGSFAAFCALRRRSVVR
jgi:PEP-CTERM motif